MTKLFHRCLHALLISLGLRVGYQQIKDKINAYISENIEKYLLSQYRIACYKCVPDKLSNASIFFIDSKINSQEVERIKNYFKDDKIIELKGENENTARKDLNKNYTSQNKMILVASDTIINAITTTQGLNHYSSMNYGNYPYIKIGRKISEID